MNSAEMVDRAKVDARAIGAVYKTPPNLISTRTQEDAINAQLRLMQMRQADMITRDTELLYTPMIFGDTPLVHGPRLWDKGRYAVNVTNTYEDRLDQHRD